MSCFTAGEIVMSQSSIIITGASRGLGRAIALELARLGAAVAINARSEDLLVSLKAEIEGAGGRAVMLAGDVSQPDVAERLVAAAVLAFGRLDGVVNNAGVLEPLARIEHVDPEAWKRNLEINVLGPLLLTQAALPHLRRAPVGRVINVSSGAAVRPTVGWSAYCSGKAALNMLTGVLALEEPELVTLAVRPGRVDTAMQEVLRQQGGEAMSSDVYQRFVTYHQQGQLLPPQVPARALAVLALWAPQSWSGEFLSWDDPRVQQLVADHS